jgi:phage-related protein
VQQALDPDDWKPMTSVGRGVRKIRMQTELAHRVFYLATFEEAVYVLHAFERRHGRHQRPTVTLAGDRYRALLKKRAEGAKKE